jgi:hypothetical protein
MMSPRKRPDYASAVYDAAAAAALAREAVASTALDRDETRSVGQPWDADHERLVRRAEGTQHAPHAWAHRPDRDGRCEHPKCGRAEWPCPVASSIEADLPMPVEGSHPDPEEVTA